MDVTHQGDLFDAGLVCAFGAPFWQYDGADHCPGCAAYSAALGAAFKADVAAGTYDAAGYTPAERKAQAKRKQTQ